MQVPCAMGCGARVDLSDFVIPWIKQANAYLRRIGEPPLRRGEVVCCDACRPIWQQQERERSRQERAADDRKRAREHQRKAQQRDSDWLERMR